MSVLAEAQRAIAEAVRAATSEVRDVYSSPRATHESMSILVKPGTNFGAIDPDGSFCPEPDISYEVVLLAGTTDYAASWEWLLARLDEVLSAFDDDPTLGGLVSGALIAGWTDPRIVPISNVAEALSISIQLLPMSVTGFPS